MAFPLGQLVVVGSVGLLMAALAYCWHHCLSMEVQVGTYG